MVVSKSLIAVVGKSIEEENTKDDSAVGFLAISSAIRRQKTLLALIMLDSCPRIL